MNKFIYLLLQKATKMWLYDDINCHFWRKSVTTAKNYEKILSVKKNKRIITITKSANWCTFRQVALVSYLVNTHLCSITRTSKNIYIKTG